MSSARDFGYGAFYQEANQINSNIANYRGQLSSIASLRQQQQQTKDLDVVKGIGQEVGIKTFTDIVGKYGGGVYKYKSAKFSSELDEEGNVIPKGLEDVDKALGRRIGFTEENVGKLTKGIKGLFKGGEGTEINELGSSAMADVQARSGSMVGLSEDFGRQIPISTRVTGGRVLERGYYSPEDLNGAVEPQATKAPTQEIEMRPMQSVPEEQPPQQPKWYESDIKPTPQPEENEEVGQPSEAQSSYREPSEEKYGGEEEEEEENVSENVSENVGESVGENVGESVGTTVAEDVTAEEVGGDVAETVGGILEATPLAPVGFLLQALGVGLNVFGGVEAGKSVYNYVSDELNPTKDNTLAQLPQAPKTIAQRGYGIIPNLDTLNLGGSVSSSW